MPSLDKSLIFLICLLPLGMMGWALGQGELQPNPVEALLHGSGDWALRLLLVTLAVTPLRRLSGWRRPLRWRRMLGLFSFFYALIHFAIYLVLDRELIWAEIWIDLTERPYVVLGFCALLVLSALAATSNRWSMARLGRNWRRLHRLVYLAALSAILHYAWLVKADLREPMIYLLIFVVLMAARLPWPRLNSRRSP